MISTEFDVIYGKNMPNYNMPTLPLRQNWNNREAEFSSRSKIALTIGRVEFNPGWISTQVENSHVTYTQEANTDCYTTLFFNMIQN